MDPEPQTSEDLGSDALFNKYLDVVNRAIVHNQDGIYGKAAKLWERAAGDKKIAVGIYKSDAGSPHHWYTVELQGGTLDVVEQGKASDAGMTWKISEDHLAHVVGDPQPYIEHPVKLDLDWLRTRVGLA